MIIRAKKADQIVWSISNLDKANKLNYDYISISVGAFDLYFPIMRIFLGMKCCRIWIGTDVLKCKFWDYRIRAKIASLFCKNICVAPWLIDELKGYGIKAETVKHEYISILSKWIPKK